MSSLRDIYIEKLNENNYSLWKFKIEQILIKEGLYDVIFSDQPEEPDEKWLKNDRNARALICLNISDQQVIHVLHQDSALATWNALKKVHERPNLSNKIFMLRKLYSVKYDETKSMQDHINYTLELAEKLRAINQEIPETNLIAILLCSLPNSYNPLITAIENIPEHDLSLEYLKNKLIDEYQRRNETNQMSNKFQTLALKSNSYNTNSHKSNSKKYCTYCKRTNHDYKECRYLKNKSRETTSSNYKQRSNNFHHSDSKPSSSNYHKNNYGNVAYKNKSVNEVKVIEHRENNSEENKISFKEENLHESSSGGREIPNTYAFNESVFKINENCNKSSSDFIIDSAATSSMSGDINLFCEINKCNNQNVIIANGMKLQSEGIGSIRFSSKLPNNTIQNIKLENVLYIPQLDSNLISVKNIVQKGFIVEFKDNICTIKKDNRIHAFAKEIDGLYKLKIYSMNDKSFIANNLTPCQNDNCLIKWHKRLGHRNLEDVKKIQRENLAEGITLNNCKHEIKCENCIQSKLTELPYPKKVSYRSTEPLSLIFSDVCGPITESLGGKKYFVTFIDDYSRYTQVFFLRSKDEVFEKLKEFIASTTNKFRKNIKALRTDNGGEYRNNLVEKYLSELGIKHEFTVPRSPFQNGISERKNRSLVEMAKAMLLNSKLPKTFWAEAVATAAYLQNRVPSKSVEKTPYELWNGHKPNLKHLKTFGCKAFAYVDKSQRRKFDNRGEIGTFIGYDFKSKGYRIYTGGTKVIIRRSVKFIENENVSHKELEENDINSNLVEFNLLEENDENIVENQNPNDDDDDDTTIMGENEEDQNDQTNIPNQTLRISSRINKGIPPDRFSYKSTTEEFNMKEPENYENILSMPKHEKENWLIAMQDEMNSLKKNDTYELVDLPKGKHAIGSKWVFKLKYNESGNKIKNKARLVAKGFSQKYKTDYDETFAPVVKHTTIRSFIANAAIKKMKIFQIDIKTAFLYGNLSEDIYMNQPEGFIDSNNPDKVWKLKKSIYGLKQSARCWNTEIENTLKALGFTQSKADLCLYFKGERSKRISLIVYVDDMLITCEDENEIFHIINEIKKKYEITVLGEAKHFLGMKIIKNDDGSYKLSQRNKIEELVKHYKLEDSKPTNTPMESNFLSLRNNEDPLATNDEFRQAIGSLLYISSISRPDITAATHILSRRCNDPRKKDWNGVKRIIRYLKNTQDLCLSISSIPSSQLTVYSDADWGQDLDDRKSTSGSLIFLGDSLVSWTSKKQTTVSLSSAEAEYVALSQATQELLWLLKLCEDLELTQQLPIKVYEDNQSAIKLAQTEKYSARTKHIDTKYHHIRDLCSKNIIDLNYLPTNQMTADVMTKPLPKPQFNICKDKMNLVQSCPILHQKRGDVGEF